MNLFTSSIIVVFVLIVGIILGYYARQTVAKKQKGTIEAKLRKKILQVKNEAERILSETKEKSDKIIEQTQSENSQRRREILESEQFLLKRENILNRKIFLLEKEKKEFYQKAEKIRKIRQALEDLKKEAFKNLERISGLSQEGAKKEFLAAIENEYQGEILEKIKKIEQEGLEKYERRAKEVLALCIQKYALSHAQEITTTICSLPSEEIKGRIIGKEGRNIRTLEKLTGVEIIIDETPGTAIISGFDPIRRQIAKIALEKLVLDGRIQPARIEEMVEISRQEIKSQIKKVGEKAVYDVGILGLEPKIVQLIGRLHFRTSYGQNVLLHSIEVAHLASALAFEIGAKPGICKKAGFLHDIGKAVDQEIEGSHVDIGIKILEKFGVEKEVIEAMKSHHEEYPSESIEATLIEVADQISGARPGARKDTLENYLKRLKELEDIAQSFSGVEKAWALQAGREIRIFVKPEEIDDLTAKKLAKEIASSIQGELRYPGEIKVNVIRETRVIEYAR